MPQKISMNDGYASNSLRILLGPWNRSIEWIEQIDNADIIVFGEGMPLQYQFHKDSMSDLLARLPNGWEPDALVFWQPHLYAMPTGWEKSEIPVFGIIGLGNCWDYSIATLIGYAPLKAFLWMRLV